MRRLLFLLLLPLILAIPRAGHAQIAANCNTISGNIGCIGTITDGTNTAANVHKLIVSGGTIAPGAPGEATLTATGTGCPLSGCTYSGAINTAGIADTSAGGVSATNGFTASSTTVLKQGLLSVYQVGSQSSEPITLAGPYSGASLSLSNAQFAHAVGWAALESSTATTGENTAMGAAPLISLTTAGGSSAFGTSVCASETTIGCTGFGTDAGRDAFTASGNPPVLFGPGAYGDGTDSGNMLVIGVNAVWGSAGTITVALSGSATGDVLSFTPSTTNACGTVNCTSGTLPVAKYTVVSGDTTAAILAGHIATALTNAYGNSATINYILGDGTIEANHNLFVVSWSVSDATNHPTVIKGHYPGSWMLSWAYSCSGTCTAETVTVGTGFQGANMAVVGNGSFADAELAAPNFITSFGHGNMSLSAISPTNDALFGDSIAPSCGTCSNNAIFGHNAANGGTALQQDALFGAYAGYGMTTGQANTIMGDETTAGDTCITTGSRNIELGAGVCVPSPTANNQLAIANIIYGTGNSGTGSTVSTGDIGIGQPAPGARLDILGIGTSTELAFRVQNSTPAVVLSISDSGLLEVPLLPADTGKSDATVCDVTSTGEFYYGTGTGGICLSTSTEKAKQNIEDQIEGLPEIEALHPVGFNYLPGHGFDPVQRYNGFLAQEMAVTLPRLVRKDPSTGETNRVDLMGLVPILVRAVQQQQAEIAELQKGAH